MSKLTDAQREALTILVECGGYVVVKHWGHGWSPKGLRRPTLRRLQDMGLTAWGADGICDVWTITHAGRLALGAHHD